MRTDGLREGAAPSLLCVSGLVSQSFPLCWEEGLLAGLFTPESTPSLPPSGGFSSALSKCVLHFSLPAFCWPCSPARSFQPSTLTLNVVGMCQGYLENQKKPFKCVSLFPPSQTGT